MYGNNIRKYIDELPKLDANYNNSYHRSIKMTPVEASLDEGEVYKNLCIEKIIRKPKFKIGNGVRITKVKTTFTRGYDPIFTEEIFVVSKIFETDPITYKIKDLNGKELDSVFYENEMVKYNKTDNIYKIEKIIRKKKG